MQVEIWSDIACPWCYVGKRRFEDALASFEQRDQVDVEWRSFELDPGAPPEFAGGRDEHLARKYGTTIEHARAMHEQMTDAGAAEGIDFHFDRSRVANTFDAHRVIHLAAAHGLQDAAKERLLRAHFSDGELVSDHATLTRLAVEIGLPEDEARDMLATDRYADEVREDERTASSLGITAVPFFVIDRAFGCSGAQPPELFGELLRRAWDARKPLTVVGGGEACGPDGC